MCFDMHICSAVECDSVLNISLLAICTKGVVFMEYICVHLFSEG